MRHMGVTKRTFILIMGIMLIIAVFATTAGGLFSGGGNVISHKPSISQSAPQEIRAHDHATKRFGPAPVLHKAAKRVTAQVRTYVVKTGDNLSAIAAHFHLPGWQVLYQLNKHVVGSNPNLIFTGQVLRL